MKLDKITSGRYVVESSIRLSKMQGSWADLNTEYQLKIATWGEIGRIKFPKINN
jgi:hypothetical protein